MPGFSLLIYKIIFMMYNCIDSSKGTDDVDVQTAKPL